MISLDTGFGLTSAATATTRPALQPVIETRATTADAVITGDLLADGGFSPGAEITGLAEGSLGTTFIVASGAAIHVAADGAFTFDPTPLAATLPLDVTRADTVTATVRDRAATTTLTTTFVARGVNTPPRAVGVLADLAATLDTPIAPIDAASVFQDDEPLRFDAAGLPPGMTIDADTGVISGAPTRQVSGGIVVVTARDAAAQTASAAFQLNVDSAPAPAYTTISAQAWTAGAPVAMNPAATSIGGAATQWRMAPGSAALPAGVALDGETGGLSGTPTANYDATVILRASNAAGFADVPIAITVTGAAAPNALQSTDLREWELDGVAVTVQSASGGPNGGAVYRVTNDGGNRQFFTPTPSNGPWNFFRFYAAKRPASGAPALQGQFLRLGGAKLNLETGAVTGSGVATQDAGDWWLVTYTAESAADARVFMKYAVSMASNSAADNGTYVEFADAYKEQDESGAIAAPTALEPYTAVYPVADAAFSLNVSRYFGAAARFALGETGAPAGAVLTGSILSGSIDTVGRYPVDIVGLGTSATGGTLRVIIDVRAVAPAPAPLATVVENWDSTSETIDLGPEPDVGEDRTVVVLYSRRSNETVNVPTVTITPDGGSGISAAEVVSNLNTNHRIGAHVAVVNTGESGTVAFSGFPPNVSSSVSVLAVYVLRHYADVSFDAVAAGTSVTDVDDLAGQIDLPGVGVLLGLAVQTGSSATRVTMAGLDAPEPLEAARIVTGHALTSAFETPNNSVGISFTAADGEATTGSSPMLIAVSVATPDSPREVTGPVLLAGHDRIGARTAPLDEAFALDLREGHYGDYSLCSYAVQAGSLPTGLAIDGHRVVGVATSAGAYSATIRVTQGAATLDFTLAITVADLSADNLWPGGTHDEGAATQTAPAGWAAQLAFSGAQDSAGWTIATDPGATYRVTMEIERTAGSAIMALRATNVLDEPGSGKGPNAWEDPFLGFLGEVPVPATADGAQVVTFDFVAADADVILGVGAFKKSGDLNYDPSAAGNTVRMRAIRVEKLAETLEIGATGTVDRVRMFETTFVFDKARPVHRAFNGSYIVGNDESDPLEIAALWPVGFEDGGSARNGAQLDVGAARIGSAGSEQGFDARHGSTGQSAMPYVASLNVDPGVTGRPIVFSATQAGLEGAVDKAVSETHRQYDEQNVRRILARNTITVTLTMPQAGRTPFQPSTAVKTKSAFRYVDQISSSAISALPSLATPAGATAPDPYAALYAVRRAPYVGSFNHPQQRNMTPRYHHRAEYMRAIAQSHDEVWAALMLSATSTALKLEIARNVVQHGIIWDGLAVNGGQLIADGVGWSSMKYFPVFAAHALNDAAMKARLAGSAPRVHSEDGYVRPVNIDMVEQPRSTQNGRTRRPYPIAAIGMPESAENLGGFGSPRAGFQSTTWYRGTQASHVVAATVFAHRYADGALVTIWDNPDWFDYLDRHVVIGPMQSRTADTIKALPKALWKSYRADGKPVAHHLFGFHHPGGRTMDWVDPGAGASETFPAPSLTTDGTTPRWTLGVQATLDVSDEFNIELADGAPTSFAIVGAATWNPATREVDTITAPGWASINASTGVLTATPPDAGVYWLDVEGTLGAHSAVARVAIEATP